MPRFAVLACASFLITACAGAPKAPAPAPAAAAEPVAAPVVTPEEAQSAADKRFAEVTRGYKKVTRDGKAFYCRSDTASGSKIQQMNCMTESELRATADNAELYRNRSKPALCAPSDPRCGGS